MNTRYLILPRFGTGSSVTFLFAAIGIVVSTGARAEQASEPHTAAAVIEADQRWSTAEEAGDIKFLDALLLPEYRSISSDGSTHDRATIIAHAVKSAKTEEQTAKADKWRTAHPNLPSVEIDGDVAILTAVLQKGTDPKPVMSCDIFLYRDGRWRAFYSKHTEAGK
ncbi:nuclear transport factor 2 family protein [Acidobacteria bacterium AB60]|nr:nuclear transport factor 2 family protein [Acidobacteria bacterium AB60]